MHSDFREGHDLFRSRRGLLVSSATITLATLAAGQGVPDVPWLSCVFRVKRCRCLVHFKWSMVCLVETSGDLAPSSDDDDAVVVRELAACCLLCLASRKPGSGLATAAIIHLATKLSNLFDPDLNCFLFPSPCTSLKTTPPSASHPACFFACLPIAIVSHSSILPPQHHQPPHNLKMKTSIALLAIGASFAFSESISDLPPCGVSLHSLLYALFA